MKNLGSHGTLLCLLLAVAPGCGFYLPGVAPHEYDPGDPVPVKVNSLTSTRTALPYDYYSLMFCRPTPGKIQGYAENLGEVLWGDVIKPSKYTAKLKRNVMCEKLCQTAASQPKTAEKDSGKKKKKASDAPGRQIKKLKARIDENYRGHLIMDNLPVSESFIWEGSRHAAGGNFLRRGYPLGIPHNKTHPTQVHNHLAFTVKIHRPLTLSGTKSESFRIVGFTVVPHSVDNDFINERCKEGAEKDWDLTQANPKYITPVTFTFPNGRRLESTSKIQWSYSIKWVEEENVAWSSRWDEYLHSTDADNPRIHWFSIVNSLLVALFLAAVVAIIMMRTLHKDFNRYNNPENEDEKQEETGWKLVHGDVFREPPYSRFLAMYLGTGCQLLWMAVTTIVFACLGFLSPANRGALMKWMLMCFVLMGFAAGYVAAVFLKILHEQNWRSIFFTGIFVPGKVFGVFFLLDIMLWTQHASNAVPYSTLLILILLWFFVTVPGVLLGGVLGFKRNVSEPPLGINQIPRQIPKQRWYLQGAIVVPLAGIVPFGTIFIELSFILSSLWLGKFYYVFGFFAVVFSILIVTCAETSIVTAYFQLCYEDYRWWWRSFLASGFSGVHLFIYSIMYFSSSLELVNPISIILYFSYMGLISYLFAITTGTVGFLASYAFIHKIYSELHVD